MIFQAILLWKPKQPKIVGLGSNAHDRVEQYESSLSDPTWRRRSILADLSRDSGFLAAAN